MELRKSVENFIENGNTVQWAVGFAVKHTVELLISAFIASLFAFPLAIFIPFLPVPGIDIVIFGISASLQDLTRISGFVILWTILAGLIYQSTRCNYP